MKNGMGFEPCERSYVVDQNEEKTVSSKDAESMYLLLYGPYFG